MATGSQAAAKARLQAANYRTGRPQFETRCDSCAHCTEGGTVQLTFRVRCKPDEKQAGRIYTLQQRELEITLTPPADGQMDMEKAA